MMRSAVALLTALVITTACPSTGSPQQSVPRIPRIGWLVYGGPTAGSPFTLDRAVLESLRDLGYVDGHTISIAYRYAEGHPERLPALADELVRMKPALILTFGGDVARVLKEATAEIPLVFGSSDDPVRSGLVASLARPGGNLTGLSFLLDELAGKRIELLREVSPRISRVAALWDPAHVDNEIREMQGPSRTLGIHLQPVEVRGPAELDERFRAAMQGRPEVILVVPGRLTSFLRQRIVDLATRNRLPVASGWREFAEAGALFTYGPNRYETSRRVAAYIDKILKGAKPADLPVEQPTKFELVVNLKTAKTLGLTIPQSVLVRADQVVQ